MAEPKPIRRVVTGNDAQGRSCVLTNLNGGSLMAFVMMGAAFNKPPNIGE